VDEPAEQRRTRRSVFPSVVARLHDALERSARGVEVDARVRVGGSLLGGVSQPVAMAPKLGRLVTQLAEPRPAHVVGHGFGLERTLVVRDVLLDVA
jgi:hypothetical protein